MSARNFVGLFVSAILIGSVAGVGNTPQTLASPSFQISPMEMNLSPLGSGANKSFLLNNTGSDPVAVQISILKREIDINGIETLSEAENDFLVFPPQIILRGSQGQSVRVTWVGETSPSKELSYRVVAEQVPIEALESEANNVEGVVAYLKVLFRYMGTVYVTPPNASPRLLLTSAEPSPSEDGSQKLALNFENQGTAHQLLRGLTISLTSEGKSVTLQGEQLKGVIGENMLAGNKRRFILPWPKELPVGPVTATFTIN